MDYLEIQKQTNVKNAIQNVKHATAQVNQIVYLAVTTDSYKVLNVINHALKVNMEIHKQELAILATHHVVNVQDHTITNVQFAILLDIS